MDTIMHHFDLDESGTINITEFTRGIRGSMNQGRKAIVEQAFGMLDRAKDGCVTLKDIAEFYDAENHPEVKDGTKTEDDVLAEFIGSWDKDGDNEITFEEFLDYYKDISAGIDDDEYFELMIRNAWHISGGKGAAANSSCRRVLVTHMDGSSSVEEIINDLGIGPDDIAKMRANLEGQGIRDIKKISTAF
eukprot:NODE_641_length_816_cov_311.112554_g633_i0.p1 GENE.NODE_641_length_816_cov_311.112554_g633_i0~~NODE_641_length_816_cov_311.112554_g633_i0.p1  ORF type:complete len:223 (+),score=45.19 NODE_641_length_816_cov_311.112554_g633_i0:100-669(+)